MVQGEGLVQAVSVQRVGKSVPQEVEVILDGDPHSGDVEGRLDPRHKGRVDVGVDPHNWNQSPGLPKYELIFVPLDFLKKNSTVVMICLQCHSTTTYYSLLFLEAT